MRCSSLAAGVGVITILKLHFNLDQLWLIENKQIRILQHIITLNPALFRTDWHHDMDAGNKCAHSAPKSKIRKRKKEKNAKTNVRGAQL